MKRTLRYFSIGSWLGLLAWLLGAPPAVAQTNTPPGPPQVPLGAANSYALLSGGNIGANCLVRAIGRVGAADTITAAVQGRDSVFALGGGNVG